MIERIKKYLRKRKCKKHGHDWGNNHTGYGMNDVPYSWRECKRCKYSEVTKIYNAELEAERVKHYENLKKRDGKK